MAKCKSTACRILLWILFQNYLRGMSYDLQPDRIEGLETYMESDLECGYELRKAHDENMVRNWVWNTVWNLARNKFRNRVTNKVRG
jgi:hypothetical protein